MPDEMGGIATAEPIDDVVDSGIDTGAEEEPIEGAESAESGTQSAEEGEESRVSAAEEDGKSLPSDLRNLIKKIRAEDKSPAASKLVSRIRSLYFGDRAFRAEFPGGLQEARAFKQQMEEVGGAERIASLAEESQQWEALDRQFSEADPAFVEAIAAENPEALVALVPSILQTTARINPEFHNALVGNIVASAIESAGLTSHLALMTEMMALADAAIQQSGGQIPAPLARVKQMMAQLAQWTDQTVQNNRKPPEVKRPETQHQPDAREQKLAEREAALFNAEAGRRYEQSVEPMLRSELAKYPKLKGADQLTSQTIRKEIKASISKRASQDATFSAKYDRFYRAGDVDGLVKLAQAKFKELLPDAVRRVNARMTRNVSGKQQVAAKPATSQRSAQSASQQWARVGQRPDPNEIDPTRTNSSMIFNGAAVLKSGRRVFWGANPPV